MLLDLFFAVSLVFPGLSVIRLAGIKTRSRIELVCFSYILSLVIMFCLLYIGGIANTFEVASLAFLAIIILSIVHLLLTGLMQVLRARGSLKESFRRFFSGFTSEQIILIAISGVLICVYIIFLSSKAILDADVVHDYLPIAREISLRNGFTYSNGYDYFISLKPIGASVLYAWTYTISGSIFSEAFRLMPLVPMSLLILLTYAIATAVTDSKMISTISAVLFLVFPFNDRFLLYTSFYPDVFYYPLIFAVIYLIIEIFRFQKNRDLFWTGLALGTASLLKAQTIYFLIAFILVYVILQLRNSKKLAVALCMFTPFYILIPSILANSIQREGFHLVIPTLTETELGLLLFLSALSGLSYLILNRHFSRMKIERLKIAGLAKSIFLLLVPFATLSSFWYLNNQIRFGTLLSTSSINVPNYNWALDVLKVGVTPTSVADFWHYFAYFIFAFSDPAVMGYVLLIPLLIGLFVVFKGQYENFRVLLFFEIVSASIVLSTVAVSLPTSLGYNPRDILPLAPLLATLCAVGIFQVTAKSHEKDTYNTKSILVALLFVAYFGLLNYVHSVYVWFISSTYVTIIGDAMSVFASTVGLNLTQTSFQLSYADRAIFVGENLLRIVSLSVIAGVPILIYWYCNRRGARHFRMAVNVRGPKRWTLLRRQQVVTSFVILLLVALIVLPRAEMMASEGGPNGMKASQLTDEYGSLYRLFINSSQLKGDIITINAPLDLPYYLYGHKIIDLNNPANLAFLKDCFESVTPNETVVKLTDLGVRYLLLDPNTDASIDASLNHTISEIVQNPELAIPFQEFGNWMLYNLGPFTVEKVSIPLSNWSIDLQDTQVSSYSMIYNGTTLFLELSPINSSNRVMITSNNLPKLNLSDYDYITVDIQGGTNARVLIRFWLSDNTGFDLAYWSDPYTVRSTVFDLRSYFGKTFRGESYIGLKSADEKSSAIYVFQISFIKVIH